MSKEELIEILKNYKENVAKLKLRKLEKRKYEKRLKEYRRLDSAVTSSFGINQDIQSKNKISNKTEKTAIDTIEKNEKEIKEAEKKIIELEAEISELEIIVLEAEIRLEALKYKEKEILYAYYVEGRTYEDIGNNLYFRLFNQTRDKDTIKDIVENAAKKMIFL
jgi:hypothetical protein